MRNCPNCNGKFSNWRLFYAQPWAPSFRCPNCKIDLTFSLLKKGRKNGIISGGVIVLFAIGLLPAFIVPVLLAISLIYEYSILRNTEISIFSNKDRNEYKRRIYVSPKLKPITGFISIVSGIILILLSLALIYLVENSSINIYFLKFVTISSGIAGIWVGIIILSNNSLLPSNKSLKNGTREKPRAP